MSAKPCAVCEASKSASVHSRWHPSFHAYEDSTRAGLQPMSRGMRAFRKESGYDEAKAAARGTPCQILSPVCEGVAEDLHEPLARGRAGGLKAALRDGPAPIPACRPCNEYVMENQVWARERNFLVSRRDLKP